MYSKKLLALQHIKYELCLLLLFLNFHVTYSAHLVFFKRNSCFVERTMFLVLLKPFCSQKELPNYNLYYMLHFDANSFTYAVTQLFNFKCISYSSPCLLAQFRLIKRNPSSNILICFFELNMIDWLIKNCI